MTRRNWVVAGLSALAATALGLRFGRFRPGDDHGGPGDVFAKSTRIEAAPPCPWRDPERDLASFFPGADHRETEVRILSGLRTELALRLGRPATAGENAIHLHRVSHGAQPLGTIAVRRVKGGFGAIELVLAVDLTNSVRGLRLQRLREPVSVADVLQSESWLAAFRGKTVRDAFQPGHDLPVVPAQARSSAQAVAEGVRDLLVLLDVAAGADALTLPAPSPHP